MELKNKTNIPYGSNSLFLSPLELILITAIVMMLAFIGIPLWHSIFFTVELPGNFRYSNTYRQDYYLYSVVANESAWTYECLFLGDSVIWGHCVNNESTLSACLNKKLGTGKYGNIAVEGMHPVAMKELISKYCTSLRDKQIFLYFNPIWLNTRDNDLTGIKSTPIPHTRLLPQFDPSIKANVYPFQERIKNALERHTNFYDLENHIRISAFDNKDIRTFIADNPTINPMSRIASNIKPQEKDHTENITLSWSDNDFPIQDWYWVQPSDSRQFKAFLDSIKLLKKNRNRVTVLIGSVNPFIQTPRSLAKYRIIIADIMSQMSNNGIDAIKLPELDSEDYADACNPLASGYEKLADFLSTKIK